MDKDIREDLDQLTTVLEGIMQAQELLVMSLMKDGTLDVPALTARLERAAGASDVRLGTQFPLLRLRDVVAGKPPAPPPWRPRVIPGGKPD
mgnify:CR=1 FL=1